jgi:CHASE2 domain-containing sensor protein
VIVAIDDASIQAIGRWPWRRAVHATLLGRLAAARPRAVVLDLLLSEPDPDPEQDRVLARAMAGVAPVVVPVAWQGLGGALAAVEPVEPLRSQALLGAAEAAVDADGVLRSAFLRAGPADTLYPHLALAALQAGGEAVSPRVHAEPGPGDTALPAPGAGQRQREGRLLIRFAGPPGTVERVSYVDVLSGAVPAARLAGRYVLIGATGAGVGDTLATPVNRRHHAMPGVEVHANLLHTLRSGDSLRAVEGLPLAGLSGLLLAALLAGFAAFGPRAALPMAVASAPLALGSSLLALGLGWWVSPVPFVLPALLAYPLWSWRRLERAVAGLDREIARLEAEPAGGGAPRTAPVPGRGDAIASRLQALQRAGTLLRQARRFLADALAAMPTAMLVADEQARVVLANPRAAALFEIEAAAEVQGLDLPRLLGEFVTAQALRLARRPCDAGPAGRRPGRGGQPAGHGRLRRACGGGGPAGTAPVRRLHRRHQAGEAGATGTRGSAGLRVARPAFAGQRDRAAGRPAAAGPQPDAGRRAAARTAPAGRAHAGDVRGLREDCSSREPAVEPQRGRITGPARRGAYQLPSPGGGGRGAAGRPGPTPGRCGEWDAALVLRALSNLVLECHQAQPARWGPWRCRSRWPMTRCISRCATTAPGLSPAQLQTDLAR